MNALPLSCIEFPSAFLCRFFLLRHESRPVAQQRIQTILCDEISPALELFLALDFFKELLAAFLEFLVVLRRVLRFLALRGRARFAGFAGDCDLDVIVVTRLVADPERIGNPIERIGFDDDRMIEPGVGLGGIGDHIDEVHPAERARKVGRLLQIGLFLRSGEFPVGGLGLARHAPALLSVLRRRNRLHAVGPKEILDEPLIGLGFDFGQRLPDGEHRTGIAAYREVAAVASVSPRESEATGELFTIFFPRSSCPSEPLLASFNSIAVPAPASLSFGSRSSRRARWLSGRGSLCTIFSSASFTRSAAMRSVSAAKPARSRTLQPVSPRTRCSSPAESRIAISATSLKRRPGIAFCPARESAAVQAERSDRTTAAAAAARIVSTASAMKNCLRFILRASCGGAG